MVSNSLKLSGEGTMRKSGLLLTILVSITLALKWGEVPQGWGDFQMGLNARPGAPSANEMKTALAAGAKLDRRYVYATTPQEVFPDGASAFLFTSWRNYAYENGFHDKGVRPTMTIYMLQKGEDGLGAVKNGAADKAFMKEYFEAILVMLDSCKGTQPIFVIEPDVWGYMLQNYESDLGEANRKSLCHINDLGFDWLEEFDNELQDLPKAIIKTVKMKDPEAYVGMLMAYWSYRPASASGSIMVQFEKDDVILSGQKAGEFANLILDDPKYRGDFIGVEKNGAGAGWYLTQGRPEYMWNDEENGKWLLWSKEMAKVVDLPLLGWQISAGYDNEDGYPELPNSANRYEDTFFSYFFRHTQEFVDAGFIGLMLGAEDRGVGTVCTISDNKYDNGFFYDKLEVFNANRPYLGAEAVAPKKQQKNITNSVHALVSKSEILFTLPVEGEQNYTISSILGREVVRGQIDGKEIRTPTSQFSSGVWILNTSGERGNTTTLFTIR